MYRCFGPSSATPSVVAAPECLLLNITAENHSTYVSDIDNVRRDAGFWSAVPAHDSLAIALDGQKEGVVGYVASSRRYDHATEELVAHISQLAVIEQYRGKRVVGVSLLRFALEDRQYSDIETIQLYSTVGAHRFYERLGFRSGGVRMSLYADKQMVIDAITLQLPQRQLT